ncbi:MAG: PIN domain-containing protein [Clostridiales Family XIII bacterium]|jgi:predicted nucleic acid-binding protein|nr:PIN domain-containing protein [Clostridiales Family XIII bacterium]
MIVDTDVLIRYICGDPDADISIRKAWPLAISSITLMELLRLARNREERRTIEAALAKWETRIVHITEEMSILATQYMREPGLADTLGIADALIAATAVSLREPLLTGGVHRYQGVPSLDVLPAFA